MAILSVHLAHPLSTPLTAKHLSGRSTSNGNFYALSVTERLGLEEQGGLLRVGLTHYNTQDEIDPLETAMMEARQG